MDITNLPTYGCFGGGEMYKLNKSVDLSKVQQYVKLEDIKGASLNSPASPVQQLKAEIASLCDEMEIACYPDHYGMHIETFLSKLRQLSAV